MITYGVWELQPTSPDRTFRSGEVRHKPCSTSQWVTTELLSWLEGLLQSANAHLVQLNSVLVWSLGPRVGVQSKPTASYKSYLLTHYLVASEQPHFLIRGSVISIYELNGVIGALPIVCLTSGSRSLTRPCAPELRTSTSDLNPFPIRLQWAALW